jgi:acyl carrier protein
VAKVPEDLEQKIIAMVAEVRDLSVEEVSRDSKLEELEFDSLDAMDVVFDVEEQYEIEVPDDVMDELVTVGDIVDGIRGLIEKKSE